jgi:hypothetical protein
MTGCSLVLLAGWDHHWDLRAGMERYLPMVDSAVSMLFRDLDDRGLLDTTLVVLCGEFNRTPKMNDGGNGGAPGSMGTPVRDHWGNSMFCLPGCGDIGLRRHRAVARAEPSAAPAVLAGALPGPLGAAARRRSFVLPAPGGRKVLKASTPWAGWRGSEF